MSNDHTPEIILHNYPQSPVAEKVRVALGIKGVAWRDVEIPRIPPKPDLVALTGGYRRTPVMQIGADIYCDSQRILMALDHLPGPRLQHDHAGLMWGLSRWTDGALFDLAVKIVLGSAGDALPADFAEDRGRLYLGPEWAAGLKAANADLPHLAAQMRNALSWLEETLRDGGPFLTGAAPGAIDAQFYHIVWFLRGRWVPGADLLNGFPHVERWENTIANIGHGSPAPMTSGEALSIATQATPATPSGVHAGDPQGLAVGDLVSVAPDVDGGEVPVRGTLWSADATTVALRRESETCGTLCIHFPRAGYRITPDC